MVFTYSQNWIIQQALPPHMRDKPVRTAWLESLSAPVEQLRQDLLSLRAQLLDELKPTGQVIQVERLLNLAYYGVWSNEGLNPITVTDNPLAGKELLYLALRSEAEPFAVYLRSEETAPVPYIWLRSEVFEAAARVNINVPASLAVSDAQILGLLEPYRPAGATVNIIRY